MPLLRSFSDGIEKLRGNAVIVALGLFVATVGGLASFTDSVGRLEELFDSHSPGAARAELSKLGIPFTVASLQEKAREGDLVAVKTLLQAGIPVDAISETNESDRANMPALAEAARRDDLAMVQTLLANHADPSADDGAAVRAAAAFGHTAILQVLLQHHPSEQALGDAVVSAASQMKLDVIPLLAAQLTDPKPALSSALRQMSGSSGWAAADVAAMDRTLLRLGADPNIADTDGIAPLILAAEGGSAEQVDTLLEAGANVNARCGCPSFLGGGWTAVALAARNGDMEKITRLIAAGADVNARNAEGQTPLMLATRRPDLDAVKALLKAGADVDARAPNGERAGDIASKGYVWQDQKVYAPELVKLLSPSDGKR